MDRNRFKEARELMSSTAGTEYIAENLQTVSFIEAVCRRPKMYTLDGTLAEVFCFLNGFYSSIANHNPPACETASHNWDGFLEWASARLAGCPTSNWADVAAALRRSYPEESVVLMHLTILNGEYQSRQAKEGHIGQQ